MSYSSQSFRNDHSAHAVGGEKVLAELRKLDTGVVNSGAGYVAQTWPNNADVGGLGVHVRARLDTACAALANAGAHYTACTWDNDQQTGHLVPEMRAKLKAMTDQIAVLRP